VVPHLGGDNLLLEGRQQALRFRKRQPRIGDVGEVVGPLDFHDVPAPPFALGADFNQPQDPGHAFPQVKDRPDNARVVRRPQNLRQSQPSFGHSIALPQIFADFSLQNPSSRTDLKGNRGLEQTAYPRCSSCRAVLNKSAGDPCLREELAGTGRVADGLASINSVLARASRNEELWYVPELQRVEGVLVLDEGMQAAAALAKDNLLQALEIARQQGALFWELRCATSVASLWQNEGRNREARALLSPMYGRFTEGFNTADLRSAKTVLDLLQSRAV
jgi:hypothetical protein